MRPHIFWTVKTGVVGLLVRQNWSLTVTAGGVGLGEKAPGTSLVMVALAELHTDLRIILHFDLICWAAC